VTTGPCPVLLWLFPALIFVIALAAMDWSRLGDLGASYAFALRAAMLPVGFCDETMFRGVSSSGSAGPERKLFSSAI
jgi:hypothetical protein